MFFFLNITDEETEREDQLGIQTHIPSKRKSWDLKTGIINFKASPFNNLFIMLILI